MTMTALWSWSSCASSIWKRVISTLSFIATSYVYIHGNLALCHCVGFMGLPSMMYTYVFGPIEDFFFFRRKGALVVLFIEKWKIMIYNKRNIIRCVLKPHLNMDTTQPKSISLRVCSDQLCYITFPTKIYFTHFLMDVVDFRYPYYN